MATTFHTAHTTRRHADLHVRRTPRAHSSLRLVSATSLGVDAEVRGMQRPTVPNYALRRVVVGVAALVLAAVSLVGAVGLMAGFTGAPASASGIESSGGAATKPLSIHVAQPGDTLWSIADTHRGDIGRDRFIEVLIRLNGDTGVIAGEAIWLP